MKVRQETELQQLSLRSFFVPSSRPCENDEKKNDAEAAKTDRVTPSQQQSAVSPPTANNSRSALPAEERIAMSALSAAEHPGCHQEQQQQIQQQQWHSMGCLATERAAANGGGGSQPRAAVGDTAAAAQAGPGGLTDYELQRLQRIRRNQEVSVLGICTQGRQRGKWLCMPAVWPTQQVPVRLTCYNHQAPLYPLACLPAC
jgi:hypothetical protein